MKICDAPTFRRFLGIERGRFERTGRPFLLLLAALDAEAGVGSALDRHLAATVLSALRRGLRETDLVGWFRDNRVVGAVLTEIDAGRLGEVACLVGDRVRRALSECLPGDVVRRLDVRCYIGEAPGAAWPICDDEHPAPWSDRHRKPAA